MSYSIVERLPRKLRNLILRIDVCPDRSSMEKLKWCIMSIMLIPIFASVFEFFNAVAPILYFISLYCAIILTAIVMFYIKDFICGYICPDGIVIRRTRIKFDEVNLIVFNTRENMVEVYKRDGKIILILPSLVDKESPIFRKLVKIIEERGVPVAVT
ncbi:MAG: hypothetical protein GXO26_04515 [Crenarchaeota archaeon]|nr:hypothetical protein [Thermoproteota archaeon]